MAEKHEHLQQDEILRGREELAHFLRVSPKFIDVLIDKKILPVMNTRSIILGNKRGVILATRRSVLDSIDREAIRQMGEE